jgi:hypothetical protein
MMSAALGAAAAAIAGRNAAGGVSFAWRVAALDGVAVDVLVWAEARTGSRTRADKMSRRMVNLL